MRYPKKKWLEPEKSKSGVPEVPENLIQTFVNKYLEGEKIDYIRIDDWIWAWLNTSKAPKHIKRWFGVMFGGRPDNTLQAHITNGIGLCLLMEIKTQDKQGRAVGKLHGKQKHRPMVVVRSIEEAVETINRFMRLSDDEDIRKLIERKLLN